MTEKDFAERPIDSVERAREYFQAMGCRSFHMMREYPDRYDEYRQLGIPEELEREWARESLARWTERIGDRKQTKPSELWLAHSEMEELVQQLRTPESLRRIYDTTEGIAPRVPKRSKVLLAETIIGRGRTLPSGLVRLAHDLGDDAMARRLAEIAVELAASARDAGSEPERCQDAIDKCTGLLEELGLT